MQQGNSFSPVPPPLQPPVQEWRAKEDKENDDKSAMYSAGIECSAEDSTETLQQSNAAHVCTKRMSVLFIVIHGYFFREVS